MILLTQQCWWLLNIGDSTLVEMVFILVQFISRCDVGDKTNFAQILQLSTTTLVQHSWPTFCSHFMLNRFWFHLLLHLIVCLTPICGILGTSGSVISGQKMQREWLYSVWRVFWKTIFGHVKERHLWTKKQNRFRKMNILSRNNAS